MSAIRPNREQFVELAASPDESPVVMLNLLKFKTRASGVDGAAEEGSGADAYKRYGEAAVKMVEEQGGRVLWQGRADQILIGDPEQDWDAVVLVEYPSRKAFIDMVTTPKYEAAHEHREAGLERTVLVAMTEQYRGLGELTMGRKILFITTDQQRYDSLGCNGGTIARTPVVDALADAGIVYRRAYNQNTVCMPARSTMLTGQYVRTHGVIANGVPLPEDAPSIAAHLKERAGYNTALLGKAHFDPGFDLDGKWTESRMAREGNTGPLRGFDHVELAVHTPNFGKRPIQHYGKWLIDTHGVEACAGFSPLLAAEPGGDTGAPETSINPIPREWYHTDWVADRTIAYLDSLPDDADWFVWMSFPDPHHPWDPPASERSRVDWRDLDLPPGHPGSPDQIAKVLAEKPAHWLKCFEGTWVNREGGPGSYRPQSLTDDNIREINALAHVMNELIDEACGRVLQRVAARGWDADTDVFFTTDHGELQGDFGFAFKGPFHTDALMRLPLVWRPAPSAGVTPAEVSEPVGHVDLAPTFCAIAGIDAPEWMQGEMLPTAAGSNRERVLCEWDSQFPGYGMHLRSIYRDGFLCTAYEKSTKGELNGLEPFLEIMHMDPQSSVEYDGSEGELYNVIEDPYQFRNLWSDPDYRSLREQLVADLFDNLPPAREPRLLVERPA